ncbi:hypothetical protein [Burkholderia cenocepacia]|uniref:hypothetical protein n=1 Tax=Burkholderia cenocepacia TaxID=95486 RepID=UPI000846971B|nr:hypothetical protein [Burkholderia cenocepacia]
MNKAKLIASMLAIAAALGTAHAAQVMGASCPEENNGTFGETVTHHGLICANGKWQAQASLLMTSLSIEEFDHGKQTRRVEMAQVVGVRSILQSREGQRLFTVLVTVVSLNPDNTAHVVMDLDEGRVNHHVDTTVSLGTPTAVAKSENGQEYRMTVKRVGS